MRKFLSAVIALLILTAASVLADTPCNDEDRSPVGGGTIEDYIEDADTVEYGLTDKTDECVSGRDGYHKDPSSWVREYYCANVSGTIQRTHKDIDCVREGYTKCEAGRCTGKTGGSSGTAASTPKPAEQPRCGDGKLQRERGEQCESPDDICYLNDKIGICTRNDAKGFGGCQCKVYAGGSGTAETPPEPSANVTPPPAETETPPAEKPEEAEEQPPAEEQEAPAPEETPVAEEREPLPEYDESKGIGVTRSITNGVKRFFRWIGSWFD
jgi:hypothetical protein